MTSQILDRFIYQDNEYIIVGLDGSELLSPQNFGIAKISLSSACMRGYYSKYSCVDNKLVLTTMTVALSERDKGKAIDGIYPVGDSDWFIKDKYHGYKYVGLNIAILFTGGFLIAKDRMEVPGPPELLQLYETVVELLFKDGNLIEAIDHSESVAEYRKDIMQKNIDYSLNKKFSIKYNFMYSLRY